MNEKLLGPRKNTSYDGCKKYSRKVLRSTWSYAIFMSMDTMPNGCWMCGSTTDRPSIIFNLFNSLEEAIEYQDKILTEDGYMFLTDEQFEKLKILL